MCCATAVSVATLRRFLTAALLALWGTGSSSREEIAEVFNTLNAELGRLCASSFDHHPGMIARVGAHGMRRASAAEAYALPLADDCWALVGPAAAR